MQEVVNQVQSGIEQGTLTSEDLDRLQKALTAGIGYAGKPTDLTGGGVLQMESLETTLKSITFDMKNLKFWPAVSIDKASNLFEQYNRLISFGSDASPYIGEGGAPQEENSTYVRDGQKICFFATRRAISHPMMLVNVSVGDVQAQYAREGTMHILKNVERELYWGHAHFANPATGAFTGSLSDLPADSPAMNGIYQQLRKGDDDEQQKSGDFVGYGAFNSIISDLQARPITQDDVEQMAVTLLENFAMPSDIHAEPRVISLLSRQFYPQFRSAPGLSNQTIGYSVNKVVTTAGEVDFKPNTFLRPRSFPKAGPVNARAPSVAGLTLGAVRAAGGSFAGGNYVFKVTLVNDFAESAPIALAAPLAVTAGDKVTLSITGAIPAGVRYIRVYRTAPGADAATAAFVANYKLAASYVDLGVAKPGLGEAYMLDMRAETMRFKQLLPLTKMNFAIVTTAIEFGILLYGALFVYCPRFNGMFTNVGNV